ncbi:hypothetical protein HZF24_16000 [Sedimentibacter hydroxybenzoicus DSM 7310]|uniref:Uncharacterized protein n=1 Tax=Sedimentibacter hydroxybenzoicus DSM 7310 TaxID=1123245 RepID=A0A974GXY7_SEDHY|nr:hypothetical protein [Sedimentibacter hydroxybenzoicus]NYB75651.1 hypothetical protein [Sedimentibacter hydroxybenzoicus DSM 7310]
MRYIGIILALLILIQVIRISFLRGRYGKKKGDFIAMTLLLSTLPFIVLYYVNESRSKLFLLIMILAVIINWAYSLYVFKFRSNK